MDSVRRTLVISPYVGEFGWELMNWQGRARRLMADGRHERFIVCARPDRRALYSGSDRERPVLFCPIAGFELPGAANEDHRVDAEGRPIAAEILRDLVWNRVTDACRRAGIPLDDAEILTPDYRGGLWTTSDDQQLFGELRVACPLVTDVVLVPRERGFAGERNLPRSWWQDLAARLERRGLRVELYRMPLDEAIRQLSGARLAAGASTGGLHLASLCRCPHYVWGSGAECRWTRLGMTNRQRYETIWNPLGTPCRYDECGWQPALEHVERGILRSVDAIGLQKGSRPTQWALRPGWRIRRGLSRLLEAPGDTVWPWRIRRLVREKLV